MYQSRIPRLAAIVAATAAGSLLALTGSQPPPATAATQGSAALLVLPTGSPGGSAAAELAGVAAAVRESGGRVLASYPLARSLLADVPNGWRPPNGVVRMVDRPLRVAGTVAAEAGSTMLATMGGSVPGAGAGLTVAVVDTGVADTADLEGRLTHINITPGPDGDGYGHGTFMAGLIAGSGAASGGQYAGVAPAAKVLDVRVASRTGETSLSQVLAGLQAVSDRKAADPGLRVLNLSLSSDSPLPPAFDPLARALDALWKAGVTVVVAAGNDGPKAGTVSSPGDDPTLLTVGSLNESATSNRGDDVVSEFSARGTSKGGTDKPDLVAPGASVVSLRSPGSVIDETYPAARIAGGYFRGSGTSMAAAVASGAAAALLTARGTLSPDSVKALLMGTAYRVKGTARGAGDGGLDLRSALSAQVPVTKATPLDPAPAAWDAFGAAWSAGDLVAATAAWAELPPSVREWAAQAWSIAVVQHNARDAANFESRAWFAREWSGRSWSGRSWSGRSWSGAEWLTAAWSARDWSDTDWAGRSWSGRSWSGRSWSDAEWSSFLWSNQAWSGRSWSGRSWSAEAFGR